MNIQPLINTLLGFIDYFLTDTITSFDRSSASNESSWRISNTSITSTESREQEILKYRYSNYRNSHGSDNYGISRREFL